MCSLSNILIIYLPRNFFYLKINLCRQAVLEDWHPQFGVNLPQGVAIDLSSPSLFPDLIKSRIFAERILNKFFYTEQYGKELPLLAILTHGDSQPTVGRDILIQKAMKGINGMVSFKNEGSFSILTVRANEPLFARDVNKAVLTELQEIKSLF